MGSLAVVNNVTLNTGYYEHKYLFQTLISIISGLYPGMELLGHLVTVF